MPFKVYGFWVELTPTGNGVGVKVNCVNKKLADFIYSYLQQEGFLDNGGVLFSWRGSNKEYNTYMIKLSNGKENTIPASELKDGQIGVITKSIFNNRLNGFIVQRCGSKMFQVGRTDYWSDILNLTDIFVKVLPNGTPLTVEDSQLPLP